MGLRDFFLIPHEPHVLPERRAWFKSYGTNGGNFVNYGVIEFFPLHAGDLDQPDPITHRFDDWPPFRL
jgi:hypothetical protein